MSKRWKFSKISGRLGRVQLEGKTVLICLDCGKILGQDVDIDFKEKYELMPPDNQHPLFWLKEKEKKE